MCKFPRRIATATALCVVLSVGALACTACSSANNANTSNANAAENTVAAIVPTQAATAKTDAIPVVSATLLNRGTKVKVVDEWQDYYVVEIADEAIAAADRATLKQNGSDSASSSAVRVFVQKQYVRKSSETAPSATQAYGRKDTKVYANAFYTGEPIGILAENEEITILDQFADAAYIRLSNGATGYVFMHGYTAEPIVASDGAAATGGSWSGGYSSGGYSSGGSTSGGSAGGNSYSAPCGGSAGGVIDTSGSDGADGGDIDLGGGPQSASPMSVMSLFQPTKAYADEACDLVLTDGLPAYVTWLNRGDEVAAFDIACQDANAPTQLNGQTLVVVNGLWGYVPTSDVRLASQGAYAMWNAYANKGTMLHASRTMNSPVTDVQANTVLTVIEELPDCLIVWFSDRVFYIAPSNALREPYVEPEPDCSNDSGSSNSGYYGGSSSYSGGYSSGSSDSGSSGYSGSVPDSSAYTGSSSSAIDGATTGWTEEKL